MAIVAPVSNVMAVTVPVSILAAGSTRRFTSFIPGPLPTVSVCTDKLVQVVVLPFVGGGVHAAQVLPGAVKKNHIAAIIIILNLFIIFNSNCLVIVINKAKASRVNRIATVVLRIITGPFRDRVKRVRAPGENI
ncbi:hypothetical protein [Sodalis sp. RH23]|uniref:hypothetical protein n=1 Tax=unclassified Sodalis (in: enterobacteria) TaxID=2636512 RepID=UPI0039B39F57